MRHPAIFACFLALTAACAGQDAAPSLTLDDAIRHHPCLCVYELHQLFDSLLRLLN